MSIFLPQHTSWISCHALFLETCWQSRTSYTLKYADKMPHRLRLHKSSNLKDFTRQRLCGYTSLSQPYIFTCRGTSAILGFSPYYSAVKLLYNGSNLCYIKKAMNIKLTSYTKPSYKDGALNPIISVKTRSDTLPRFRRYWAKLPLAKMLFGFDATTKDQ